MKTLITTLFTFTLGASISVYANDEVNLEQATNALVKNSSVQMESKLDAQLRQDIHKALYSMRLPQVVEKSPMLLAKRTKRLVKTVGEE